MMSREIIFGNVELRNQTQSFVLINKQVISENTNYSPMSTSQKVINNEHVNYSLVIGKSL